MIVRVALAVVVAAALSGCAGDTAKFKPVSPFDADRYMGRWYEIARFPHSFEKGLTGVTADYAILEGGKISVLNRGFDPAKGAWREAKGRAKFAGSRDVASLKVSFFGPFYAPYKVLELDPDYQWALVASGNYDYLWFLAREPAIDVETFEGLRSAAAARGFDLSRLERVDQSPNLMPDKD